jgi:hypothetical protein
MSMSLLVDPKTSGHVRATEPRSRGATETTQRERWAYSVPMRTIRQLLCVLRGGHKWETVEDPFGGVTTCSRCGKLRHVPGDVARDPDARDPNTLVGGGE